jgi:hypothetical protein
VFNVALMKRPNRTPNGEAMFLNNQWQSRESAESRTYRRRTKGPLSLSVTRASHAMSLKAWHS